MANDSSMKSIQGVESYAKKLKERSRDIRLIFRELKKQTDYVSQNWSDKQFVQFRYTFNESMTKQIEGICRTLENLSEYTQKQCYIHRQAQQEKLHI